MLHIILETCANSDPKKFWFTIYNNDFMHLKNTIYYDKVKKLMSLFEF